MLLPLSPPPSSPTALASSTAAPVSTPSAVVASVLTASSAPETALVVRLLLLHDVDDLVGYAQVFDLPRAWPLLASFATPLGGANGWSDVHCFPSRMPPVTV